MAIITYRMQIFAEDGYVISNSDVAWESMPQKSNIERSGIRVYNAPIEKTGQIVANIDDYVKLSYGFEDISPDFEANYLKALHGQLDNWKLMAVKISKGGHVCLAFVNVDTLCEEDLYIESPPYLRIMFEKELEDGTVEKTLLVLSSEDNVQKIYYDYGILTLQ